MRIGPDTWNAKDIFVLFVVVVFYFCCLPFLCKNDTVGIETILPSNKKQKWESRSRFVFPFHPRKFLWDSHHVSFTQSEANFILCRSTVRKEVRLRQTIQTFRCLLALLGGILHWVKKLTEVWSRHKARKSRHWLCFQIQTKEKSLLRYNTNQSRLEWLAAGLSTKSKWHLFLSSCRNNSREVVVDMLPCNHCPQSFLFFLLLFTEPWGATGWFYAFIRKQGN